MQTVNLQNVVVGKQYVVLHLGTVLQCNTQNNPMHPCRITVTKKGRSVIHTDCSIKIKANSNFTLLTIEDAKVYYREMLNKYATNTQSEISALVNAL